MFCLEKINELRFFVWSDGRAPENLRKFSEIYEEKKN